MQYLLTFKTNIDKLKPLEGEVPFPDRSTVGNALIEMTLILTDMEFEQRHVIPFELEGDDIHSRFDKGDEFAEIEIHPRGEEVLATKELDALFAKLEQHLTGGGIETVVLGVIEDVYHGKCSRKELLIPPLTVGDVRAIKGWWRTKWIVDEMVNASCGRTVRMMLSTELGWGDERMLQEGERVMKLFAAVEVVQPQIVDKLVQKTIALYGDKPIDMEASKRARMQLVAFMEKESGQKYDDEVQKYD